MNSNDLEILDIMPDRNPPKKLEIYDRSFVLKKQGRIAILYSIKEWNRTRYGVYKFSEFPYVEYKGNVLTTRKVRSAYFFNKGVYETYQRAQRKFEKLEQEYADDSTDKETNEASGDTNWDPSRKSNVSRQDKLSNRRNTRRRRRYEENRQLRLFFKFD